MELELRWILSEGTTEQSPILQYRTRHAGEWGMGEWCFWRRVPFVVVSKEEFTEILQGTTTK